MQRPHMLQIKASAGSGKTHTITHLFLDYLAQMEPEPYTPACPLHQETKCHSWGDIMAITFTNAAAAEMKERVLSELKRIALGQSKENTTRITAQTARTWVDTLLRQYGALNIRTIDSLLHLIVRTAALEKKLPPDFENTFRIHDMLEPIYAAFLERARNEESDIIWLLRSVCTAVANKASFKGFGAGTRIIDNLSSIMEHILTKGLPPMTPAQDLAEALERAQETYAQAATTLLELIDRMDAQLKPRKSCIDARAKKVFEDCAQGTISTSAYMYKGSCAACALKDYKDKVTDDMENAYALLRESAYAIPFLQKALREYPFVQLAYGITNEVESFQQKYSLVHGATIPLRAYDILRGDLGVPTALCRLGNQMQHILLDEFQDTNREQWNALLPLLVEALSTGGSLTWVGDIKQAIYGWRGGDAALFDELLQEPELIAMVPSPEKRNLPTNWRSKRVIVETNNTLFAPLANMSAAQAILAPVLGSSCPPTVMMQTTEKLAQAFEGAAQSVRDEYMKADAYEGFYTCTELLAPDTQSLESKIKDALHERLIHDIALRRPWEDVAILVRSNKQARQISTWLFEWGVPVITENSLLLDDHPLVRESIAFFSFLNAPQDDVSFWTVLQGRILAPLLKKDGENNDGGGIVTAHMLEMWLAARTSQEGKAHTHFVSMAFRQEWPHLWDALFAPFFQTTGLMTPYNCLQEWYRLCDVPQRFQSDATFVRSFLECVHQADVQGLSTLGSFLHHWEQTKDTATAPMPSAPRAVRIMTVHKSKGQQFPVVILPATHFSIEHNAVHIPFEVGPWQLFIPRCKEMGDIYYDAIAQDVLEAFNVLYVACTRAEDEMHILNTQAENNKKRHLARALHVLFDAAGLTTSFTKGTQGAKETESIQDSQDIQDREHTSSSPQRMPCHTPQPDTVPRQAPPMHWLPSLKIYRNPLGELVSTQHEQHTFSPRKRGLLLHYCLEVWQSMFAPSHKGSSEHIADAAIDHAFHTFTAAPLPTSTKERETLRQQCLETLLWYGTLPGIHTHHALPEQEILDADGTLHRVDVLIPPHNGAGWRVIDYKSGHEHQGNTSQIQRYLRLLDSLPTRGGYALPPSEGLLVYLDLRLCRMCRAGEVASELLVTPQWHSDTLLGA